MRTRIYYRGPDALVSDDQFVWHPHSAPQVFAISDLRNVGLVQAPSRIRPYAPALAAGALAAAVAGWTLLPDPAIYVLVFLGLAVPGVAMLWREPGRWELHAQYRGTAVVLYSSADARVFNQVSRALRRAMEDTRRTPWGYGLAAA
ncbi:hypothetical protein GCM10010112_36650 [Actinoplanes lobatus]|uniref:Uncharacterized protein n=1 Tax=Actinoplanes lobatus TaxID=113568 RepID=A0A7W7HCW8_9ACTN|nr:DUF6232 family protein [Actinoplanes lobatus]MBB4748228.1 hypothetical protein [Actinoplanes lobatus]GGN70278.1 hypothetical protein GCM10010112_36650 [Actinoplanes lobatus]GIE40077.1 hypothetical protein Alo02nite_29750 [Actinoplanes lobatus]